LRTLGILALAAAAQGLSTGSSDNTASNSADIVSLLKGAGPTVILVLVVLLLFSAASWGIIVYKHLQLRRALKQSRAFLEVFRRSSKFSEVQAVCGSLGASPLVGLFQAGYAEVSMQLRSTGDSKPGTPAPRPTLRSLEAVDRALIRASTIEVAKLEHRVPFLATTASITPYVGLFGTVWGIMTSFQMIANAGATSIGVVAPGIAEALVTTAGGLFAAIPAVYFYNDLTSRVKATVNDMEDFSMEFLTIVERNFT
jgi:biopolymer transport protein TolQ